MKCYYGDPSKSTTFALRHPAPQELVYLTGSFRHASMSSPACLIEC
jgi:hypothetical protein